MPKGVYNHKYRLKVIETSCFYCGKTLEHKENIQRKSCGNSCTAKYYNKCKEKSWKWIQRETRTCACGCGQTFECKINDKQKFISGHNNAKYKIKILTCLYCRKQFRYRGKNERRAYCSIKCYNLNGFSREHKKHLRIAAIKRVEQHCGIASPNFNLEACKFFKSFDKQNNTFGKYALYGGGEHQVKELGYFLDYINFDKKLIMEYDEPAHYDKSGKLKQKDVKRQEEIQKILPDFEFKRIKGY